MSQTLRERHDTRAPARPPVVGGLVVLVVLLLVMTAAALPGVRPRPGVIPLFDDWIQTAAYVLAAALVVWRAWCDRSDRVLWSMVGLALTLRAAGFGHLFFVSDRAPAYPSLADAFWILGALLLLGALVVVALRYAPHQSRTLLLDASLGAVVAAAVALEFLSGTFDRLAVPGAPADVVGTNLAYPILDVALLVVVATLVAATHGRLSMGTLTLCAGVACFAVLDAVFLYQVTLGLFRPGSLLTPLSLLGTVLIAFAAWLPHRDREAVDPMAASGLALPTALAMVCVGVGTFDALGETITSVVVLCATGVSLAILRAYLTLGRDRSTASTLIAKKDDEILRFRALVEASDDFIAIGDVAGGVHYINPAGRRLIGLPDSADLTGAQVTDFIAGVGEASLHSLRPGLAEGGSWRGDSALLDQRGGPAIPVLANTFLLGETPEGPQLMATIQRDVTDLRAAEADLMRFRALVEASDDFIAMGRPDGTMEFMNPAGRRMVGLSDDDEISQTHVGEFVPNLQGGSWIEGRPGLAEGGSWRGDSELTDLRGGPNVPVTVNAFVVRHPETSEPWLIATIQRDVTDLRAAEADLQKFRALVDASSDFIAIAGVDGRVQYVNAAGRELVGLDPETDVTQTTIADYLTEEGLQASVEIEQPAVLAQGYWRGESTLRNLRGGPLTPVLINSFLVRDPETDEPLLLATVQRDITERRAAEQSAERLAAQRWQLLADLVEAQEAERARIAADVHDDSVQALAAVDLQLGLLKRRAGAVDADELLATIELLQTEVRHATDRLRHLLFDLDSPAQRHDLGSALREAAATIFATGPRWEVEVLSEADLPETQRVIAYRMAKEAMVNASKHAHASAVEVVVRPVNAGVEVAVTDDGTGPDLDGVVARPGHRGIPDMRDRAASAGGWVRLEHPQGGGTTVRIWLPSTRST